MASFYIDVPVDVKDPLEYIKVRLLLVSYSPAREYLLQCARWAQSMYVPRRWVAYSHINDGYSDLCLFDLSDLKFADNTDLMYISWGSGYFPITQRWVLPGNLYYMGKRAQFVGVIWTCAE